MTHYRRRFVEAISEMPAMFWLLWIGTLINRIGGFVAPFLSLYLTGERGVSVTHATFVISLLGAGSFVGRLVGGSLSDRIGRRPVMLVSFLVTPAIVLAVGFAKQLSVLGAEAFVLGFFTDLYRPAVSAAIADLVPPHLRVRAFSYIYWAINLGAAVAPVIGGLLARVGYLPLFAADAATTFLFGLIILMRLEETQPEGVRHVAGQSFGVRRIGLLLNEPSLLFFAGLTFLFGVVYAQSYSTLPVAMSANGIGPSGYGAVISLNGLLIVLVGIAAGRKAERWRPFRALAAANVLLGTGFGVGLFATSVPLYGLTVAVWTLGEIINAAVAPAVVADFARPEVQGLYQGLYGAAWGLAFFVGPALGGWVFGRYGSDVLWLGCFAVGLFAAIGYLLLARSREVRTVPPPEET